MSRSLAEPSADDGGKLGRLQRVRVDHVDDSELAQLYCPDVLFLIVVRRVREDDGTGPGREDVHDRVVATHADREVCPFHVWHEVRCVASQLYVRLLCGQFAQVQKLFLRYEGT